MLSKNQIAVVFKCNCITELIYVYQGLFNTSKIKEKLLIYQPLARLSLFQNQNFLILSGKSFSTIFEHLWPSSKQINIPKQDNT